MKNICINYKKERGAILVVSLLMLLMLTIIGVASIKTTTIQERMAGNLRDRELAFQAAEAALSIGERYIISKMEGAPGWVDSLSGGTGSCTPSSGICKTGTVFNPFTDTNWDGSLSINDQTVLTALGGIDSADLELKSTDSLNLTMPQFVIQKVGERDGESGMKNHIFKVTAKGKGGDVNSEVVLQSTFSYIL